MKENKDTLFQCSGMDYYSLLLITQSTDVFFGGAHAGKYVGRLPEGTCGAVSEVESGEHEGTPGNLCLKHAQAEWPAIFYYILAPRRGTLTVRYDLCPRSSAAWPNLTVVYGLWLWVRISIDANWPAPSSLGYLVQLHEAQDQI
ncbi:hypothetical protein TWF173_009906 [Orbilia oligospora]|nr:hypothetical protein TWF173_009906 [Orbilia oligospora]